MPARPIPRPGRFGLAALGAVAASVLAAAAAGPAPVDSAAATSSSAPDGPATSRAKGRLMITIVYDNYPLKEGLRTAWGFGCVVQGLEKTILFDTGGNGRLLLANMAACGIRPETIDAVVISHRHGDHAGGLEAFLAARPKVTVYVPKPFPDGIKEAIRRAGATLVETEAATAVCDRAWTTPVLGRGLKEQALALEATDGLVVVTGCAHPGVVEMAESARKHAGRPVRAVLGGFHMMCASQRGILEVVEGLRRLGVRQVGPCHCSGDRTRKVMQEAYGEGYLQAGVGARLAFPLTPEKSLSR